MYFAKTKYVLKSVRSIKSKVSKILSTVRPRLYGPKSV